MFNHWKAQSKRAKVERRPCHEVVPVPLHPLAEYVDLCIPNEVESNRSKAKKRFENMVQTKEPWVKMARRFDIGIFVVFSAALCDEK